MAERSGKKNCDPALILALAAGGSAAASAAHAGVSERTARRRLRDPRFRARVDAARAEMVRQSVGRLSAIGVLAGDTLKELMGKDHPAAIRLGAARGALEYLFRGHELDTLTRQVKELREALRNGTGNAAAGAGADNNGDGHPAPDGVAPAGADSPGPLPHPPRHDPGRLAEDFDDPMLSG
jgi:hypothetical protein